MSANEGYAEAREEMVALLRRRSIRDERVLAAMSEVPRHEFVPAGLRREAYGDHALTIGSGQTISQPFMVALMTELLELSPESRVLEIGAGSGYQTAILAALAGDVFAVERLPDLAPVAAQRLRGLGVTNVALRCADGTNGWPEWAPYDAILVAAGGPAVPKPLVEQLAEGGRLVAPVGTTASQRLVRLVKTNGRIHEEDHGGCVFVKLIGEWGFEE
jgi:protein-L-isoaspartate(D-aspartate) O-methyltransferase